MKVPYLKLNQIIIQGQNPCLFYLQISFGHLHHG